MKTIVSFILIASFLSFSPAAKTLPVPLDGRGSHGPDGILCFDSNRTIVGWKWAQVSGSKVTISNANASIATALLPWKAGTYQFSLVVTNFGGAVSKPDTMKLIVKR